jgi:hypothetical protein
MNTWYVVGSGTARWFINTIIAPVCPAFHALAPVQLFHRSSVHIRALQRPPQNGYTGRTVEQAVYYITAHQPRFCHTQALFFLLVEVLCMKHMPLF